MKFASMLRQQTFDNKCFLRVRKRMGVFARYDLKSLHSTSEYSLLQKTRVLSTSSGTDNLEDILSRFRDGKLDMDEAQKLISLKSSNTKKAEPIKPATFQEQQELLGSFATLDHDRTKRTGFPEAVFAEGKTVGQVASILEDMAHSVNEKASKKEDGVTTVSSAILATRVPPEMYAELAKMTFKNGSISYHEDARIVTMTANARLQANTPKDSSKIRVVVATAGTTDIPVSEEAAVTLEAAGCEVDRIYDCGVAGLHRILRALPRLTHPDVGCVIVCAGMDGALPSVVGGLVRVPVIAVPTSIGYGASFGGISAMLTMLNSCSPGVGVVNIDNGFGAAALAYKCLQPKL